MNNQYINEKNQSFELKLYLFLRKIERKIFQLLDACFIGFWLGVLDREKLYCIDQLYYDGEEQYRDEKYNCQGLWDWEKQALQDYFQNSRSVLLIGSGGGREVLALHQSGYEVDGFECNPQLVEFANELMEREGLFLKVQWAPRDSCPEFEKKYDGIIVGWGAYMLIQGRQRRIEFLQQLRTAVGSGSPILLSFFCTSRKGKYFQLVTAIGNIFRKILRREQLDIGDILSPNFVHYFTKEEIAIELQEAGFRLEAYRTTTYGHAIGISQ